MEFLEPRAPVVAARRARPGHRLRRRAALAAAGDGAVHPGRPARPRRARPGPGWRRHVVAGIQLLGLAAGVVAIARPISTTTERTESEGRILVLFDVSLSMMATDVDPTRLDAAKAAAREFVDQVDEDVEVGLISFSGSVAVEVQPTLDREALDQGIEDLELAESTAIGDALAHGSDLLTQLAGGADAQQRRGRRRRRRRAGSRGDGAADRRRDDGRTARPRSAPRRPPTPAIPVFTIAFGTPEGSITDPASGEVVPVPVQPEPLEQVAEVTGGAAYEAATGTELADAYERDPRQPRRHARRGDRDRHRADVALGRRAPSSSSPPPGPSPCGGSAAWSDRAAVCGPDPGRPRDQDPDRNRVSRAASGGSRPSSPGRGRPG